jgi:hypothetical protein
LQCKVVTSSDAVYLARSLIRPKEEQVVLTDPALHSQSELVLLEVRARLAGDLVQEEIICVEKLVTEEIIVAPFV